MEHRKSVLLAIGLVLFPIIVVLTIYPKQFIQMDNDYIVSDDLLWSISSQSLKNNEYYCEGWVIFPGIKQEYAVLEDKSIWLHDKNNDLFYKIKSQLPNARNYQINTILDDNIDYQSSFFNVSVDLKNLNLSENIYEIYICYQLHENNYLAETDYSIVNGYLVNRKDK